MQIYYKSGQFLLLEIGLLQIRKTLIIKGYLLQTGADLLQVGAFITNQCTAHVKTKELCKNLYMEHLKASNYT